MRYTFAEVKAIEQKAQNGDDIRQGHLLLTLDQWNMLLSTIAYYENLAGEEFKAPLLTQATTPFLVDELGQVRKEIKARQTYEGVLKIVLQQRRDADPARPATAEGESFGVTFETKSRTGLDSASIKTQMGEEWVRSHSKITEYVEMRTYKK